METVISLLEVYSDAMPNVPQRQPFPLPINHLKIVKTAVGVVLNASLGFGGYRVARQNHMIDDLVP